MSGYELPTIREPKPLGRDEAVLVASGDLRLSANQVCWPAQEAMEQQVVAAFAREGVTVHRGHPFDADLGHGFIWNQRMGMDVFKGIHPQAPLIVAEAVWQYSHHVLAGLRSHQGPILTLANWSGQWPGLVGLLNLNASLTKASVVYDTIWSVDFEDEYFKDGLRKWIRGERIVHDASHVRDLERSQLPADAVALGDALARHLRYEQAILGIFDEGCMGMYNAIIDDEMLNPMGIYKERLSQSALVAAMRLISDEEAREAREWLDARGLVFETGDDPETELTDDQIREQLRMYIASVRIASDFGCDAIGIQYQQGLKDMVPASDLAEGLLNNGERPPVYDVRTGEELFVGSPLPHFNEVDECAGVDALVTKRIWRAMNLDPATTLHDLRWGEYFQGDGVDDFVWVLQISGAAPASHFNGGYAGASSERQPPMYFPLGGGTLKGVGKPGEIVWSRVFIFEGELHADLGRATVVGLPPQETERRWNETTSQWPIVHTVLHGVSRDQMMGRHKANHINIAYAPTTELADQALAAKSAMMQAMGIQVHLCGDLSW